MDDKFGRREWGKDLAGGRDEKTGDLSIPDYVMRDYEALEGACAEASASCDEPKKGQR